MTLDEAIKERQKVIEVQEKLYEEASTNESKEIIKSAIDNDRQLAEWLTELKEAREILRSTADFFARVETEKDCFIRVPCEECPLYNEKNDLCRWKYADAVKRLIE